MSIKYGEINVIYNDTMIKKTARWFGMETYTSESDDIIILFDNNTIVNVNDTNVNDTLTNHKKFMFSAFMSDMSLPSYFKKEENTTYFKKTATFKNDKYVLNFKPIFSMLDKYTYHSFKSSIYNTIYYKYKFQVAVEGQAEVFSILKIVSNEDKPRYLLAYDSNEFTTDEVVYLVDCMFKNNYNKII